LVQGVQLTSPLLSETAFVVPPEPFLAVFPIPQARLWSPIL